MRRLPRLLPAAVAAAAALVGAVGLGATPRAAKPAAGAATGFAMRLLAALPDAPREVCRAAIRRAERQPELPGAPGFDAHRIELLGRARGEPLALLREPRHAEPAPDALVSATRVRALVRRHRDDPAGLRARVLREGYLYSPDPAEALALVTALGLEQLFDEPELWLQRGERTLRLVRTPSAGGRAPRYHHADSTAGSGGAERPAELLFGDRLATSPEALAAPLHRDLAALGERDRFERARILFRGEAALVAELDYGELRARALLAADGPALSVACLDAAPDERRRIAEHRAREAVRRRAIARVRSAVDALVAEALPFDRPREEPDHLRDGILRPEWLRAYRAGATAFSFEERSYAVFDARGRPTPPEVCVDFVLDAFERASGTWFRPRGEPPGVRLGGLDLGRRGAAGPRGVLGLESFAAGEPARFEVMRIAAAERVPFAERSRFFGWLAAQAGELRPGDVVAIQGTKRDGHVHQHALLVEAVDPLTGFPHALADQMSRPRRRTWEGIMAEAPRRSLLYRIRPTAALLAAIAGDGI